MRTLTTYILLTIFAIIFGISQSIDSCFYRPDQRGKKCFDTNHSTYTCCPVDHHCQKGKCISLGASLPLKRVPIHTYILIGVGVALIGLVTVMIGVLFWQRRQMKQIDESFEPAASFSQPSKISFRNNSSVGVPVPTPTSEPSVVETTVNIETSTA